MRKIFKGADSDRRWFQGLVLNSLGEESDHMLEEFTKRGCVARQIIITGPRPDLAELILEHRGLPVCWMDWGGLGNIDGWTLRICGDEMDCERQLRFDA